MSDFVLDPDYLANLAHVSRAAQDKVLGAIADDARRLCPVDTGALKASITVRGDRVEVGTDHWLYVEYGTRYMHAQPFMRPALYRQRGA